MSEPTPRFSIRENANTEVIQVKPNGEVWVRGDAGLINTGLTMPTPLGHPTLEYGFEVMRQLGLSLAAQRTALLALADSIQEQGVRNAIREIVK